MKLHKRDNSGVTGKNIPLGKFAEVIKAGPHSRWLHQIVFKTEKGLVNSNGSYWQDSFLSDSNYLFRILNEGELIEANTT